MTDIQTILADRGKTHGSYVEHAEISNVTFEFWASRPGYAKLKHDQKETLKMLAHKIGRVLAGTAEFEDHWRDMAGYATLSADEVAKRQSTASTTKVDPGPDPYARAALWPDNLHALVFKHSAPADWNSLFAFVEGVFNNVGRWPTLAHVDEYITQLRHAQSASKPEPETA